MSDRTDDEAFVLARSDQGIAWLTLNRPSSRNALSTGMIEALISAFDSIAQTPSIRVVVLQGLGPAFCAGHDLKEIRSMGYGPDYAERLFARCALLMQKIIRLPQPVLARVHGVATAAGLQLVASCDLAIAADNCRFATPGVNIGLFCSTPMVALSRNVSRKHAMQLLLTGDLIDAETAFRMGIVNELVTESALDDAVLGLARKIASKSRSTLTIGKEAFYLQAEMPLEAAYRYAGEVMAANLQTSDAQEGISAFIDKRPPQWEHL